MKKLSLYYEIDILKKPMDSKSPSLPLDTSKRSIGDLEDESADLEAKRAKKTNDNMPMMEPSRKRPAPGSDDEVSIKSIKKLKMVENSISCPICVTKTLKCYDLVHHLANAHYSKELFSKYPLKEGDNCQLCQEEGRGRMVTLTKNGKSNYVVHVGKVHLRVLSFLSQELQQELISMLKKGFNKNLFIRKKDPYVF